jgi:predicted amidophosphoribosyltransferase
MALASCKECGGQVSTEAKTCPHCGKPNPAPVCFAATAVYGNYNHPALFDLRLFKYNWLSNSKRGHRFINWYCKKGRTLAVLVSRNIFLKKLTLIIINPLHLLVKSLELTKNNLHTAYFKLFFKIRKAGMRH